MLRRITTTTGATRAFVASSSSVTPPIAATVVTVTTSLTRMPPLRYFGAGRRGGDVGPRPTMNHSQRRGRGPIARAVTRTRYAPPPSSSSSTSDEVAAVAVGSESYQNGGTVVKDFDDEEEVDDSDGDVTAAAADHTSSLVFNSYATTVDPSSLSATHIPVLIIQPDDRKSPSQRNTVVCVTHLHHYRL